MTEKNSFLENAATLLCVCHQKHKVEEQLEPFDKGRIIKMFC